MTKSPTTIRLPSAPAAFRSLQQGEQERGTVYLLHFDTPVSAGHTTQHYMGVGAQAGGAGAASSAGQWSATDGGGGGARDRDDGGAGVGGDDAGRRAAAEESEGGTEALSGVQRAGAGQGGGVMDAAEAKVTTVSATLECGKCGYDAGPANVLHPMYETWKAKGVTLTCWRCRKATKHVVKEVVR